MDANVDTVMWVRSRMTLHDITWAHNNLTCGTHQFFDMWAQRFCWHVGPTGLLTCGTYVSDIWRSSSWWVTNFVTVVVWSYKMKYLLKFCTFVNKKFKSRLEKNRKIILHRKLLNTKSLFNTICYKTTRNRKNVDINLAGKFCRLFGELVWSARRLQQKTYKCFHILYSRFHFKIYVIIVLPENLKIYVLPFQVFRFFFNSLNPSLQLLVPKSSWLLLKILWNFCRL